MRPPDTTPVGFAVKRLFSRGCRLNLRVVERSPAVFGELELVTLRYANERALRVLELRDSRNGIQPKLLPPLHDPILCTLGSLGFLVRGIEAIEEGGQIREYTQEWHVKFIAPDGGDGEGGNVSSHRQIFES